MSTAYLPSVLLPSDGARVVVTLQVSLGIDVEPDCPPYLATQYRGVVEALPRLLDLLDEFGVRTTCFTTGQVAERYPERVAALVARGHELGCHGHTHRRFTELAETDANAELERSSAILRSFGSSIMSFRAPNLVFPREYLGLLSDHGYSVDSSQAKYKLDFYRRATPANVLRIPASMTSSVLRLSPWLRDPWLSALTSPVVLFVHPWEFVDLTRERLRLDCRFRTGEAAFTALRQVLTLFRKREASFVTMAELAQRARMN